MEAITLTHRKSVGATVSSAVGGLCKSVLDAVLTCVPAEGARIFVLESILGSGSPRNRSLAATAPSTTHQLASHCVCYSSVGPLQRFAFNISQTDCQAVSAYMQSLGSTNSAGGGAPSAPPPSCFREAGLMKWVLASAVAGHPQVLRLHDPIVDPRFNPSLDLPGVLSLKSTLCIPIYAIPEQRDQSGKPSETLQIFGLIQLANRLKESPSDGSVSMVTSFGSIDESVLQGVMTLIAGSVNRIIRSFWDTFPYPSPN
eukprot:NODE_4478_length_796_cov_4.548862_g3719_i0.p1 GENE.NODE_4478_length_796_cov_4.548862_g3719_i0~~NODE_4478_length_796_cov_4.548862_g3719_i0.p1  ORF type:complete len:257 (+),score=35.76 NODE_4478_length_796_cov_4.548862_g3719_i0:3-773(+)